eukprot:CAMPEP_0194136840 /NCGR_PEP_ID=MMETSP0152-20130528/6809_1 /TAXON_ID=1049557 /ORGANISM="Thalassiothrix antarctica, Strain L6-D1" /LENGTH=181 /DNA_ID=CAMNT_0038833643 /DNA_START=41 /DNA_END=586 /DNA_ORIENTATION=-
MTKEDRKTKYTAIAKSRRDKLSSNLSSGNKHVICFQCRKPGHTVANCPEASGNRDGSETIEESSVQLCYKCGSTAHSLSECPRRGKSNDLPFAKCYICNEMGHLASSCSKNEKGIYINGGSCRYCESTEHLATKCPNRKKKKRTQKDPYEPDVNDLIERPANEAPSTTSEIKKKKRRVVNF